MINGFHGVVNAKSINFLGKHFKFKNFSNLRSLTCSEFWWLWIIVLRWVRNQRLFADDRNYERKFSHQFFFHFFFLQQNQNVNGFLSTRRWCCEKCWNSHTFHDTRSHNSRQLSNLKGYTLKIISTMICLSSNSLLMRYHP